MNDPHGVSCEDFFLNQVFLYAGYYMQGALLYQLAANQTVSERPGHNKNSVLNQ